MTRTPQRETGLPGCNLTSPQMVLTSSSSNHGEYVFTCRTCGSTDLASLWGGGFLDELTVCNACGSKTHEDPDCTLHFPEFAPDYAAIAPYAEPAAAEVAA